MVILRNITKYFRLLPSTHVIKTCSFYKVTCNRPQAIARACALALVTFLVKTTEEK